MEFNNRFDQEKQLGGEYAKKIELAIINAIKNSYLQTTKSTGRLIRETKVKSYMKFESLSKITISQPYYGFILNYGFNGTTKNKQTRLLKATNHLALAVSNSGILEKLAAELAAIKGDQVIDHINF